MQAWQAAGRPTSDPWDYAIALRKRLDSSGLRHVPCPRPPHARTGTGSRTLTRCLQVRILAPDGDIAAMVRPLRSNASYRDAVWGLGQHYPGGR